MSVRPLPVPPSPCSPGEAPFHPCRRPALCGHMRHWPLWAKTQQICVPQKGVGSSRPRVAVPRSTVLQRSAWKWEAGPSTSKRPQLTVWPRSGTRPAGSPRSACVCLAFLSGPAPGSSGASDPLAGRTSRRGGVGFSPRRGLGRARLARLLSRGPQSWLSAGPSLVGGGNKMQALSPRPGLSPLSPQPWPAS